MRVSLVILWCILPGVSALHHEQIGALLRLGGVQSEHWRASELVAGFSNAVYKVEAGADVFVAKIFSKSARARCPASERGVWDYVAGEAGVGPRVLAHSAEGLLSDFVAGKSLESKDLRANDWALAVDEVAPRLAELHQLPCKGPAVLWRGVDALLEHVPDRNALGSAVDLRAEVMRWRRIVDDHVGPPDVAGHGDCKASNILQTANGVVFVDYELAGPNYSFYDLAKLLRDPDDERARPRFVASYLRARGLDPEDALTCLFATQLFVPLTFLEATIFFVFMVETGPPDDKPRWTRLARQRWAAYEASVGHRLDETLVALELARRRS